MKNKTAVVTGATSGIGTAIAARLLREGYEVYVLGRDSAYSKSALAKLNRVSPGRVHWIQAELASLDSVAMAAHAFLARHGQLNLLICNAGVPGPSGRTDDGYEVCFGVNYLAHFLLTQKLLPALQAAQGARVVHVASRAHFDAPVVPYDRIRQAGTSRFNYREYGESKLAQLLHVKEMAKRYPRIATFGTHPGVVATRVWRVVPAPIAFIMRLFMRSPKTGAQTSLRCALEPGLEGDSGAFFENCKRSVGSPVFERAEGAAELWEKSMEWIKPWLHTSPALTGGHSAVSFQRPPLASP